MRVGVMTVLVVALAAFVGASVPREAFPLVLLGAGLGALVWVMWPDRRMASRAVEGALASGAGLPPGFEVEAVITDVDGVLTDGRIHRVSDGAAMRSFHVRDGLGQKRLVGAGIKVAWLSATTERESIIGRARMIGLEEERVDTGEGDKGPRFERLCGSLGVEASRVIYVGDDVNDLPAMRRAGLGVCPADAHPEVRAAAGLVLRSRGGEGALREVADMVLAGRRTGAR